jgi:hypothetical protein
MAGSYPVQFDVDFPVRSLNRATTAFRIFLAIPILIVLGTLPSETLRSGNETAMKTMAITSGLVFVPLVLMIVFRQKYPRWWYDWNLNLMRFSNRVAVYLALLDDHYPSTDEEQAVHLDFPYPDAHQLNRWLPLIKWFLALPHYFVLIFLGVGACVAVIIAWFAILVTGAYPRGLFDFVVGVIRWSNRVTGYAFTLVTDEYPPFSLS